MVDTGRQDVKGAKAGVRGEGIASGNARTRNRVRMYSMEVRGPEDGLCSVPDGW
jgi:hypothetical protein